MYSISLPHSSCFIVVCFIVCATYISVPVQAQYAPKLKDDFTDYEIDEGFPLEGKNAIHISFWSGNTQPRGTYGGRQQGVLPGFYHGINADHFWNWWGIGLLYGTFKNYVGNDGYKPIGNYYGYLDQSSGSNWWKGDYLGLGPSLKLGNGWLMASFTIQGGVLSYSSPSFAVYTVNNNTELARYPTVHCTTGFIQYGGSVHLNFFKFLSFNFQLTYFSGTSSPTYTFTHKDVPPGSTSEYDGEDYINAPVVKAEASINPKMLQVKLGFSVWLRYNSIKKEEK